MSHEVTKGDYSLRDQCSSCGHVSSHGEGKEFSVCPKCGHGTAGKVVARNLYAHHRGVTSIKVEVLRRIIKHEY
jgi:predicted RNA-binding Zn-ribbon protein involved in translation (DUF1610 family)